MLTCLFLAFANAACFEVDEWVKVSASGETTLRVTVRIAMDAKQQKQPAPQMNIGAQLQAAQLPGVRVTANKVEQRDGQMIAQAEVTADHFAGLERFYQSLPPPTSSTGAHEAADPAKDLAGILQHGTFYRASLHGTRIRLERTIVPTKSAVAKKSAVGKKGKRADFAGLGDMTNMLLGSIFMRFALTVPSHVVASNAETVDGQTLHWVFPMPYLATHKTTLWTEIDATPEARRALLGK